MSRAALGTRFFFPSSSTAVTFCESLRVIVCHAVFSFAAFWRWQHKYVQPRRGGIAPFFQVVTSCMIVFYVLNYKKIREYRKQIGEINILMEMQM